MAIEEEEKDYVYIILQYIHMLSFLLLSQHKLKQDYNKELD